MQCRSGGSTSTPGDEIDGEAGIASPGDEASAYVSLKSDVIGLENRNPENISSVPLEHDACRAHDALPVEGVR
jgi:hypothetical protein